MDGHTLGSARPMRWNGWDTFIGAVGGHSRVGGQLTARPYSIAPTKNAIANLDN